MIADTTARTFSRQDASVTISGILKPFEQGPRPPKVIRRPRRYDIFFTITLGDIDSKRVLIRVEMGKCRMDRHAMLSPQLLLLLRAWWVAMPVEGPAVPRPGSAGARPPQNSHRSVRQLLQEDARDDTLSKPLLVAFEARLVFLRPARLFVDILERPLAVSSSFTINQPKSRTTVAAALRGRMHAVRLPKRSSFCPIRA
jgi:hypothetical protein